MRAFACQVPGEKPENKKQPVAETFWFHGFLALSGGFQDAYTYLVRDHVFANAQTGNLVLMSTHIANGRWMDGLHCLFPVLSFATGVFCAERISFVGQNRKRTGNLCWQQKILLLEILFLFLVGFLPETENWFANALVSFSCAMQVQAFRSLAGNPYASTMCIGNLRSGTAALSRFLRTGEKSEWQKILSYYGIIGVFAAGAAAGGIFSSRCGLKTIWISCILLFLACAALEWDRPDRVAVHPRKK